MAGSVEPGATGRVRQGDTVEQRNAGVEQVQGGLELGEHVEGQDESGSVGSPQGRMLDCTSVAAAMPPLPKTDTWMEYSSMYTRDVVLAGVVLLLVNMASTLDSRMLPVVKGLGIAGAVVGEGESFWCW